MDSSGTLTMKFLMNGELIVGTMDAANIEIRQETGEDNMLTFGLLTPEIDSARFKVKHGEYKVHDDCFSEAIGQISNKMYCGSNTLGLILSQDSINLICSGLMMYTVWTLLFLIEIKNNCQIGTPKKFP